VAKKKGCLGCSFPVAIIILLALLGIGVVSFLSGTLGKVFFGDLGLPAWLSVPTPSPEIPASTLFHVFNYPVTNTTITAWLSIILLTVVFYFGTRKLKMVPGRFQMALESVIGYVSDLCNDVVGEKYGRKFFVFVTTIFLFVITNAWMGLIPGVGSIIVHTAEGEAELFRAANTDINLPLALAILAFFFIEYWGIKINGFKYFGRFANTRKFTSSTGKLLKGDVKAGIGGMLLGFIDIFIGIIELFSELMRIVSFTFRLFGNMIGGEILLLMMLSLAPFLLAIPFYGLEVLVGFIQALVFSSLTLVFTQMAITPSHQED